MVLYNEAGELIQTGDEEMNLDINKKVERVQSTIVDTVN